VSSRRGYPSDPTDSQWELVKDLLPEPSGDGRPEKHPRREIVNAILSADLPPWQTVYWCFVRWEEAGVTEGLLAALRVKARVS
jgi:transposase